MVKQRLKGAHEVMYGYDGEDLLTTVTSGTAVLEITRDPQKGGLVTATKLTNGTPTPKITDRRTYAPVRRFSACQAARWLAARIRARSASGHSSYPFGHASAPASTKQRSKSWPRRISSGNGRRPGRRNNSLKSTVPRNPSTNSRVTRKFSPSQETIRFNRCPNFMSYPTLHSSGLTRRGALPACASSHARPSSTRRDRRHSSTRRRTRGGSRPPSRRPVAISMTPACSPYSTCMDVWRRVIVVKHSYDDPQEHGDDRHVSRVARTLSASNPTRAIARP